MGGQEQSFNAAIVDNGVITSESSSSSDASSSDSHSSSSTLLLTPNCQTMSDARIRIYGIGFAKGSMVFDYLMEAGWKNYMKDARPRVKKISKLGRERCFEISSSARIEDGFVKDLAEYGGRIGFRVKVLSAVPYMPFRCASPPRHQASWVVCTHNVATLRGNEELVMLMCHQREVDILCLQETKRTLDMMSWHVKGYSVIESRPKCIRAGEHGMALLVKHELRPLVLYPPTTNTIWIVLKGVKHQMVICNAYVPTRNVPGRKRVRVLSEVVTRVQYRVDHHPDDHLVVMGDFNMSPEEVRRWIESNHLPLCIVSIPSGAYTFKQNDTESVLDYILVYKRNGLMWSDVRLLKPETVGYSDHCALVTRFWSSVEERGAVSRISRSRVVSSFMDYLDDASLQHDGLAKDTPLSFCKRLKSLLDQDAFRLQSSRALNRRGRLPRSLEKKLRKSRGMKRRIHSGGLDSRGLRDAASFIQECRNELSEYRTVESTKELVKGVGAHLSANAKGLWKWISRKTGRSERDMCICVYSSDDGSVETDERGILEEWRKRFSIHEHASLWSEGQLVWMGHVMWWKALSCCFGKVQVASDVTWDEICVAVRSCRKGSACGVDGIPIEAFHVILERDPRHQRGCSAFLYDAINASLVSGVSEEMNTSIVVPVYKGGDRLRTESYRGIHMMNSFLRIVCKIVATRFRSVLDNSTFLLRGFGGFGPRERSVNQVMVLSETLSGWMKDGSVCYACFLNYKDAFDSVNQTLLQQLLQKAHVPACIALFVRQLYFNPSFRVRVNGCLQQAVPFRRGLRQGCPLSPVLFVFYMTHLLHFLDTDSIAKDRLHYLFTGDTLCLYSTSESDMRNALRLLSDRNMVFQMRANMEKSASMVVFKEGSVSDSRVKTARRSCASFGLNGKKLRLVKEYRYLGVLFTETMDVKAMARERKLKTRALCSCMYSFLGNGRIPLPIRARVVESVLYPVALHGCEVWGTRMKTVGMVSSEVNRSLRVIVEGRVGDSLCNHVLYLEADLLPFTLCVLKRRLNLSVSETCGYPLKRLLDEGKATSFGGELIEKIGITGYRLMNECDLVNESALNQRRKSLYFWQYSGGDTVTRLVHYQWRKEIRSSRADSLEHLLRMKGPWRRVYLDVWNTRYDLWRGCRALLKIRCNGFYCGERLYSGRRTIGCVCPCCGCEGKESVAHYLQRCAFFASFRRVMVESIEELSVQYGVSLSVWSVVSLIVGVDLGLWSATNDLETAVVFDSHCFPRRSKIAIESVGTLREASDMEYEYFYKCAELVCEFLSTTYDSRLSKIREWKRELDKERVSVRRPRVSR